MFLPISHSALSTRESIRSSSFVGRPSHPHRYRHSPPCACSKRLRSPPRLHSLSLLPPFPARSLLRRASLPVMPRSPLPGHAPSCATPRTSPPHPHTLPLPVAAHSAGFDGVRAVRTVLEQRRVSVVASNTPCRVPLGSGPPRPFARLGLAVHHHSASARATSIRSLSSSPIYFKCFWMFFRHVASLCFKCFIVFRCMFKLFYGFCESKLDTAYVAMVIYICCTFLSPMFHLYFFTRRHMSHVFHLGILHMLQ